MGKDKTFLQLASKLWSGHRRFEEMCALAVTGQLGGAQMCELDEHIAGCKPCREYLESIAQVSVQAMPLLAEKRAPLRKAMPPTGMRERFLALIAEEPGQYGPARLRAFRPRVEGYPTKTENKVVTVTEEEKEAPTHVRKPVFSVYLWRSLAAGAACAMIATAAHYAGTRRTIEPRSQLTQVRPDTPPKSTSSETTTKAIEPDRVNDLERQKSELETKLAAMKQELAAAQTGREYLNKELASAQEKLVTLTEQAEAQPAQAAPVAQQTNQQLSTLQADVSRLSRRLAEAEVNLGIQKQTNEDLSSKLELMAADLQRERDLKSAKSAMGELVAGRNLHIVDVYDADPNGKRQQSFGRVFYIEGKSLVFYAYDLDASHQLKANVVFHVWGGKAGVTEVTHSLGILHKDDAGQNRWAMTFDDPSVLGQINAVFVTAESASKHYDQPHGKKVLYAYFGSPANHP